MEGLRQDPIARFMSTSGGQSGVEVTVMDRARWGSISELPRSWARTNTEKPAFTPVTLPFTSLAWLPIAEIPHRYSFNQIFNSHLCRMPDGFVLQSCSLPLRDYLIRRGCQSAAMGAEAVLDLPWQGKRSVRELARRGRRHGTVREVEPDLRNRTKLIQLAGNTRSRQQVVLTHTARSGFDSSTRCFVFETHSQEWIGAVTLSMVARGFHHTELILRHQQAPVGTMEALILTAAQELAAEGASHLSLGGVTPVPAEQGGALLERHRHPSELWTLSQLIFRLGRALRFAFNGEGLWQFKDKFSPRWQPTYLCASPCLSWSTILGMITTTGYFNLVRSRLHTLKPARLPGV